ncbi:MAG TPA: P-II family nitrogen regulator [Myxococcota bacterium]|nr:P-II family nitrogen regulator [Myxococcota bacterium]
MSKVEIILGAERLAQIQDAIADVGVGGMTVSEVGGIGRGSAGRRKARFKRGFAVQLKIEIVLETGRVPSLIDQILRTSRTPVGDGKILIHPIDNAIQIRTNRRGYDAV